MLRLVRVALAALGLIAGTLTMINIHEVGHTAMAWLMGDHSASYALYKKYPNGGYCFGCNAFDPFGMSAAAKVAVVVGGVLATQAATWMLFVLIARRRRRPAPMAPPWSIVVAFLVVFAMDLPFQLGQGAVGELPEPNLTGVDFSALLTVVDCVHGTSERSARLALGLLTLGYVACWLLLWRRMARQGRPQPPVSNAS